MKAPAKRSIKDILAELKEEHEWRVRLHDEVRHLKLDNKTLRLRMASLAEALAAERIDLMNRANIAGMRVAFLNIENTENSGKP